MRAQAWVVVGLGWLALPAMLDRPGLRWLPSAHAEPKGPEKPNEKPSEKPSEKPNEKPSEKPNEKPSEKPSDKPGAKSSDHPSPPPGDPSVVGQPGRERPPQVRTYSSVTVVDDPKQAPPLPTGRKEPPAPAAPRPPPAEPRRDESPAGSLKDDRPTAGARRAEELKELRRDLRELRQDLREHRGARGDEPPERLRGPADPEGKKRLERATLRERLRNGRD